MLSTYIESKENVIQSTQKKQRKKKRKNYSGDIAKKKSSAKLKLTEIDEDEISSLPPPPYRHPPPYQSAPYKRKMSFTTIIQHTVYEDDFEELSGQNQNYSDAEEFPGPIIELASSTDNCSDKESAV